MTDLKSGKSWSFWARLSGLWKDGKDPAVVEAENAVKAKADVVAAPAARKASVKVGPIEAEASSPEPSAAADDDDDGSGSLGSAVWKVVGAAAAGITATGFLVAVGGAVYWIRFDKVGLPAAQGVSLLPKNELLAEGAQQSILFVGIALLVVALIYLIDREGKMTRRPIELLFALALGGIAYVVFGARLDGLETAGLIVFAVGLFASVVATGVRSGTVFWPLALSVFVSSLVFSATVGLLIVDSREYAQGVAVLRGATDSGLTGVYVSAGDSKIYLGRFESNGARGIFEVPREGAAFAVGPPRTLDDAQAEAKDLLETLKEDRETNPPAPASEAGDDDSTMGDDDAASDGAAAGATETAAAAPSAGSPTDGSAGTPQTTATAPPQSSAKSLEAVTDALRGSVEIHHRVSRASACLVRFTSIESSDLGQWWVPCAENEELAEDTGLEIRDRLALPARSAPVIDKRVIAELPPGTKALYLTGRAAPQCEHRSPTPCGHRYRGGAPLVYLPDPSRVEVVHRQCTATRQDAVPVWGRCQPE